MNDEHLPYDEQRPSGDDELDDRLIAFALGLEDDAELRAQLAASPELRARLERVRGQLAAVEDGLQRAVPEEPEAWADLSSDRWSALQPYVSTEQTASPASRRPVHMPWWRRWPALAPTAAVIVIGAVVIGAVVSSGGLNSLETGGSDEAAMELDKSVDAAGGAAAPSGATRTLAIEGAAAYGTVVIAEAGEASDGTQSFSVVRTLKGSAPGTVTLDIEVDGGVASGSLAVLFLDPLEETYDGSAPQVLDANGEEVGNGGDTASGASPTSGEAATAEATLVPMYLYDGAVAGVVTLPEGVDANDVRIE